MAPTSTFNRTRTKPPISPSRPSLKKTFYGASTPRVPENIHHFGTGRACTICRISLCSYLCKQQQLFYWRVYQAFLGVRWEPAALITARCDWTSTATTRTWTTSNGACWCLEVMKSLEKSFRGCARVCACACAHDCACVCVCVCV